MLIAPELRARTRRKRGYCTSNKQRIPSPLPSPPTPPHQPRPGCDYRNKRTIRGPMKACEVHNQPRALSDTRPRASVPPHLLNYAARLAHILHVPHLRACEDSPLTSASPDRQRGTARGQASNRALRFSLQFFYHHAARAQKGYRGPRKVARARLQAREKCNSSVVQRNDDTTARRSSSF